MICSSFLLLKPYFHVTVVRGWKRWAPEVASGSASDDVLRPNQSLSEQMRLHKVEMFFFIS